MTSKIHRPSNEVILPGTPTSELSQRQLDERYAYHKLLFSYKSSDNKLHCQNGICSINHEDPKIQALVAHLIPQIEAERTPPIRTPPPSQELSEIPTLSSSCWPWC